jgi:hypothetical protein
MNTITIEKTLFKFNELSNEAQQKAIEKNFDINVKNEYWFEHIVENFKENEYFNITNVYFSGFWSQGDGAMFEYNNIENKLLNEFLDTLKLTPLRRSIIEYNIYFYANGTQRGLYYHENSCLHQTDFAIDNFNWLRHERTYKALENILIDFEAYVIEKYKDFCINLYSSLEEEYNYQTSEEVIKESILANDYDFEENGEIF